mgnify:CR=1 FL=1
MVNHTQSNRPVIDDWTEYKRLVLSELERLNQAVDKLNGQYTEIQTYVQSEISAVKESLNDKINELDKCHPNHTQFVAFKTEIEAIEKNLKSFQKEQQHDSTAASRWGFWAAIISIVGSLIVSVISLIVALK